MKKFKKHLGVYWYAKLQRSNYKIPMPNWKRPKESVRGKCEVKNTVKTEAANGKVF